jgi:AcrR family transcriptional regulator
VVSAVSNDQKLESRREIGKAQTRQSLIDAALVLFATDGYDRTTAEAIAKHAGVSARTFFRHFATKESVLFFGEDDFYRLFIDELAVQPKNLSELAAIASAYIAVTPSIEGIRGRFKQYRQAIATSSALRGQEQSYRDNHVADVAKAVARRRGQRRVDNSCRVVAEVGTTVFELAVSDWVAGPARTKLATTVADRFQLLTEATEKKARR